MVDRFFHDDFKFKVNMGNKKELNKKDLMAKNEQERQKRQQFKTQTDASTQIQKHLRQYQVNNQIAKRLFLDEKMAGSILVIRTLIDKAPQERMKIIDRGLQKIIGRLNVGLSNLRSKSLIKKLEVPLAELVGIAIEATTYLSQPSSIINRNELMLLIFQLTRFGLRLEITEGMNLDISKMKSSFRILIEKVSRQEIIGDRGQNLEFNRHLINEERNVFLRILREMVKLKQINQITNDQLRVLQSLQRIALNTEYQGYPSDLSVLILQDQDIVQIFNNLEQSLEFLRGVVLPWFENFKPQYCISEIFQLSTLLCFIKRHSYEIPPQLVFTTIKDILKFYLEFIKSIKKLNPFLNKQLTEDLQFYNQDSVIRLITSDIRNNVMSYQKEQLISQVDINLSSQITSVILQIMRLMDVNDQIIERDIIFRSNMLVDLATYIHDMYSEHLLNLNVLVEQVRSDLDLFKLFLHILHQRLRALDDLEFLGQKKGLYSSSFLNQQQSKFIADLLNKIAFKIFQNEQTQNQFDDNFRENLKACLNRLHDRDRRLSLYPKDFWIVDKTLLTLLDRVKIDNIMSNQQHILYENAPQTIPFEVRAVIFKELLNAEKSTRQNNMFGFLHADGVEIRREYILEDSFAKLFGMGEDIKNRLRIQFVDLNDIIEEGVDGGGLFKEFMTKLTEIIFNPQYAFFSETQDRKLYPNHLSQYQQPDYDQYFKFFGMIVGKAIYEGILLKCSFAKFFLNKFADKSNTLDDLQTYDQELYNNLMFLKYYEGDARDLGLSFSVSEDFLGKQLHFPLIHDGEKIEVTNENKLLYIMHYTDYILNKKIKTQVHAFQEGLYTVISKQILTLFFPEEIQLLISGGKNEIDVDDLRRNTVYHGYRDNDPYIVEFWNLLKSLPNEEKENFLVFVTGTNRPPLLGFKYLNPMFCIHQILLDRGEQRFPTSSTCMNMLKLPHYGDTDKMKQVLRYAINSNAGFNLE